MQSWEVGGGRAPRQPGQVRKEAAAVSFRSGRSSGLPPFVRPRTRGPPRRLESAPHVRPVPGRPAADPPPPPDGPGLFGDAPTDPVHAVPYRVLARKYRPTSFNDLIGQEAMVRILRNAFATGRVAHAFMLTGVRGVGKTTTARIIARALNCTGPDGAGGPDRRSLRRVPRLRGDPRRPPSRRDGDGRRQPHRRGRRARDHRGDALPPDPGPHQGVRHRRSPHAVAQRVQRAAEDAGGAAAAREVRVRHHRTAQGAGHRAVALPALRPAAGAHRGTGGAFRPHRGAGGGGGRSRPRST